MGYLNRSRAAKALVLPRQSKVESAAARKKAHVAAMAFYAGTRPPTTNEKSRDQAAFFGAQQTADTANYSRSLSSVNAPIAPAAAANVTGSEVTR